MLKFNKINREFIMFKQQKLQRQKQQASPFIDQVNELEDTLIEIQKSNPFEKYFLAVNIFIKDQMGDEDYAFREFDETYSTAFLNKDLKEQQELEIQNLFSIFQNQNTIYPENINPQNSKSLLEYLGDRFGYGQDAKNGLPIYITSFQANPDGSYTIEGFKNEKDAKSFYENEENSNNPETINFFTSSELNLFENYKLGDITYENLLEVNYLQALAENKKTLLIADKKSARFNEEELDPYRFAAAHHIFYTFNNKKGISADNNYEDLGDLGKVLETLSNYSGNRESVLEVAFDDPEKRQKFVNAYNMATNHSFEKLYNFKLEEMTKEKSLKDFVATLNDGIEKVKNYLNMEIEGLSTKQIKSLKRIFKEKFTDWDWDLRWDGDNISNKEKGYIDALVRSLPVDEQEKEKVHSILADFILEDKHIGTQEAELVEKLGFHEIMLDKIMEIEKEIIEGSENGVNAAIKSMIDGDFYNFVKNSDNLKFIDDKTKVEYRIHNSDIDVEKTYNIPTYIDTKSNNIDKGNQGRS